MDNTFVDSQRLYDRKNFTTWCYNLFELNERLYMEQSISEKLYTNENGYLLRSYFVVLWEIIYNGKKYLEMQMDKHDQHLAVINGLIDELLDKICNDDYFLINYYRNCASHIFLTRYSPLNGDNNPKGNNERTTFYYKDGNCYSLTYEEIIEKVEKVYGNKHGVYEEPKYKRNLISSFFPIIHEYNMKMKEIDKSINETFSIRESYRDN